MTHARHSQRERNLELKRTESKENKRAGNTKMSHRGAWDLWDMRTERSRLWRLQIRRRWWRTWLILTRGQKGQHQKMWGMSIYRKIFLVLNRLTLLQALKNSKAFCFRPLPSTPSQERVASQLQPLGEQRRKWSKGIGDHVWSTSWKPSDRDVPDAMFHPDFVLFCY